MRRNMRSGMNRRRFLGAAGAGAAGAVGAALGMSGVASAAKPQTGGILDQLMTTGRKLRVAIQGSNSPGMFEGYYCAEYDPEDPTKCMTWMLDTNEVIGLEADLARALAMAVWGPSGVDNIEWMPSSSATRFTLVDSGQADVCFRACTWTGSRDAYQTTVGDLTLNAGVAFAPVYFYDGMDILVNGDKAPEGTSLSSMSIGVQVPSTTYDVLVGMGLSPVTYGGDTGKADRIAAFLAGEIDAMAGDSSDVAAYATTYTYLYFTSTTGQPYGKEPLAPFVAEGDQNWHDIVSWVMYALFEAYEKDFRGENLRKDWGWNIGTALGIDKMWAKNAVSRGHYGDLFEQNWGYPPEGKNKLWLEGGLIFSNAFR